MEAFHDVPFLARGSLYYTLSPVRPSVRHTSESYKNG